MRISRINYYMQLAQAVAQQSTCIDKQVGCVLIDNDGIVLATGYNGNPKDVFNCCDHGVCSKNDGLPCYAVHAEINALLQRRVWGIPFVAYCTLEPCIQCTAALINAGCTFITYLNHTNYDKSGLGLWSRVRPAHTWRKYDDELGR